MTEPIKALEGLVAKLESGRNIQNVEGVTMTFANKYDGDYCADQLAALIPDLKAERECVWEPEHNIYTQCGVTSCDVLLWGDTDHPKFCPNCGGKVVIHDSV
jgi:hypothetical protein